MQGKCDRLVKMKYNYILDICNVLTNEWQQCEVNNCELYFGLLAHYSCQIFHTNRHPGKFSNFRNATICSFGFRGLFSNLLLMSMKIIVLN